MRPYRWTWKTARRNSASYWWDFKNGVRAIWVFRRALWRYRNWDYSGLLELMETAARDMRPAQVHHVGAERTVRQLTAVAELCRRLRDDDYFHNAERGITSPLWKAKHSVDMATQDAMYLGKMFKFVHHWWD